MIEGAAACNCSAYAPDLPGCVAVALRIEGLREAGEAIPEPPEITAAFVSVAA